MAEEEGLKKWPVKVTRPALEVLVRELDMWSGYLGNDWHVWLDNCLVAGVIELSFIELLTCHRVLSSYMASEYDRYHEGLEPISQYGAKDWPRHLSATAELADTLRKTIETAVIHRLEKR